MFNHTFSSTSIVWATFRMRNATMESISDVEKSNSVTAGGQKGTSKHVRLQSWERLTGSCADLSLQGPPPTTTKALPWTMRPASEQPQHSRKRSSDGNVKDDQAWKMSDLEDSLLSMSSTEDTAQVQVAMDMDILRRRIAIIQAWERGAEARSRTRGSDHAAGKQKRTGRVSSDQQQNRILDWKEEVLR